MAGIRQGATTTAQRLHATKSRKVAVIGAGAAGLVAARELRAEGHAVTVLESGPGIGGVWAYTPAHEAHTDPLGRGPQGTRVHSSMYASLRTNLPREIMGFSDFPFVPSFLGPYSRDARRFCSHNEVLAYLHAFADYHQLRDVVRFNERVLRVEPMPNGSATTATTRTLQPRQRGMELPAQAACQLEFGEQQQAQQQQGEGVQWAVTSERLASHSAASGSAGAQARQDKREQQQRMTQQPQQPLQVVGLYDAVVVANGHYSQPNVPDLPGIAAFPGRQVHSHSYRTPDGYEGKVVLVVGASNSGEDISRELSGVAARVVLSARSWKDEAWGRDAAPYGPGGNIYRYPMVSELHADGSVTFSDGSRVAGIDAVVYCTGFTYTFPFLAGAASEAVHVADNNVSRLWLHMLPPSLAPGLSFLGLPWKVVPFPQFELQAKLVARLLSGRVALPSAEEMDSDIRDHYQRLEAQDLPLRYAHMQNLEQFAYNHRLAALCGHDVAPRPAWREAVYRATGVLKRSRPNDYRDAAFGLTEWQAAMEEDFRRQVQSLTGQAGGSLRAPSAAAAGSGGNYDDGNDDDDAAVDARKRAAPEVVERAEVKVAARVLA